MFQDLGDVKLTMRSVSKDKSKLLSILSSKPLLFRCDKTWRRHLAFLSSPSAESDELLGQRRRGGLHVKVLLTF